MLLLKNNQKYKSLFMKNIHKQIKNVNVSVIEEPTQVEVSFPGNRINYLEETANVGVSITADTFNVE